MAARLSHAAKAVLFQAHSIAGLALALLLSLIALTGATLGFEDEIRDHLNADLMQVAPRSAAPLMPDELVARLAASGEFGKVSALTLSGDPNAAVHVRFARDGRGDRPTSLYVDPYDARVLGAPRGEAFFATVRRLHRWLLLPGDGKGWGRPITGTVALCLVFMLLSGLVLRWPRRSGSVKNWLKPQLGLGGRVMHRSLHSVVGTWLLPIYLAMALTGPSFSFAWYKDGLTALLARPHGTATKMPAKPPQQRGPGEPATLGFDRAWNTFQREEGDRVSRALLTLPQGPGTAIRIRSWRKTSSLSETTRDEFRIDALTGQMISAERYADKTFGEKTIAAIYDIHRGAILGWPGKLAFVLAAMLMPLFAVTGILLYLSRRRLRRPAQKSWGQLVPGE